MKLVVLITLVLFGQNTGRDDVARALREAREKVRRVQEKYGQTRPGVSAARGKAASKIAQIASHQRALKRSSATGYYKQIIPATCPLKKVKCCLREDLWLAKKKDDMSVPGGCARIKTFFCDGTSPEDYIEKMGGTVNKRGAYGDCPCGTRDVCPVVPTVTGTKVCSGGTCNRYPMNCEGADCNIGRHIGTVIEYACTKGKPACGNVTSVKGKAWVKEPGGKSWRPLKKGEKLSFSAELLTGRRSSMVVKMANGATLQMGSRSVANLKNMGACGKDAPKKDRAIVDLIKGSITAWMHRVGRDGVVVSTLFSWSGIRGTRYTVSVNTTGRGTEVVHRVMKGKVEVIDRNTGRTTFLTAGKSLRITALKGKKPRFSATTYEGLKSAIKNKKILRKQ